MSKKLGLVLGAGGSRGVAHVGFLRALDEAGIKPYLVTGSSMGSVVGSCYCAGLSTTFMQEEILKLKMSDLFDLSLNPIGNAALLRSKKVYKKLEEYLGDTTFNQLKIPFNCVSVDILTGQTVTFLKEEKALDGVVASCSIPGVFKPFKHGEQMLVDGGIKCRLPIDLARDMGADVVVAVDVLGEVRPCTKKYNIMSVLLRTIEIYDSELTKYRLLSEKPDMVLYPDLGDMNQFKFKGIPEAVEKGYELGLESVDKIKKLIEE